MIQAQDWIRRADAREACGDSHGAVETLQRAAAWHTAQIGLDTQDDPAHARVCERLAELLLTLDRMPEAIQAYQEAVDAYGRSDDSNNASRCARQILALTKQLWQRPQERLYLLIARMEREIRQLEECEDTERQRADIHFRIGTILQRRDRFEDAGRHYELALTLYDKAGESELEMAGCHHRIAGLYHYELKDPDRAARHYREAIRLYRATEAPYDGEQLNRVLCEQLLKQLVDSSQLHDLSGI